jgi:hypothetical protein
MSRTSLQRPALRSPTIVTMTTFLLLPIVARPAAAHDAPIDPSACALAPFVLSVPAAGVETTIEGETLRTVYDAATSTVQMCPADATSPRRHCAAPTPRAFTLGDVTGTLAFPPLLTANLYASGDFDAFGVPLTFTVGGVTTTIEVALTTGLAASTDTIAGGAPLEGSGIYTLVGVLPAASLAASFGDASLVLRATCQAMPVPDLDQFGRAVTVESLRGAFEERRTRLRATLDFNTRTPADLTGRSFAIRVTDGDTTLALAEVPVLTSAGRELRGASSDGRTHVTLRRKRPGRFGLTLEIAELPRPAAGRRLIGLTVRALGFTGRGQRLFRPRGGRLRAP